MTQQQARIEELDGLRGIAILIVMMFHTMLFGPNQAIGTFSQNAIKIVEFGWSGVDLFFTLSGFLIASILFSERNQPHFIRHFFIKRFFRIFPPFLLIFGIIFLLGMLLISQGETILSYVIDHHFYFLTMTHNFLHTMHPDGWYPGAEFTGHLWSLAVEVQFYLVAPILLSKLSARNILILSAAIVVSCMLIRFIMWQYELNAFAVYTNTISRIDSIFWGVIVASIVALKPKEKHVNTFILVSTLAFFIFFAFSLFTSGHFLPEIEIVSIYGFSLVSAFYASLLLYTVTKGGAASTTFRLLKLSALKKLGKYSFMMYLFHQPLLVVFHEPAIALLGKSVVGQLIYFPFILTVSFLFSALSWKFIEGPCLRYARKLSEASHTAFNAKAEQESASI